VGYLTKNKITLLQDGARAHVSKRVLSYLERKKVVSFTDYPPYSPDLNPIEKVWGELKKRVGAMHPLTEAELISFARICWNEIPLDLMNRYVKGFEGAVKRCTEKSGKA
jgi:transposase